MTSDDSLGWTGDVLPMAGLPGILRMKFNSYLFSFSILVANLRSFDVQFPFSKFLLILWLILRK